MNVPFYRQPRLLWAVGLLLIGGLLAALYLDDLQALFSLKFDADFWWALVSFGFAFAAPVITRNLFDRLVSQFVMPVYTLEERRQAYEHFLRYSSGLPGPAIFVKEGQLVASEAEKANLNRSAGVVLVDNASGIVLRTDTQLTRAEGPGVVFTRRGEYIEALDLRKQVRRAEQVQALTRDGIEVRADISVIFILDGGEAKPIRDWQDPKQSPYAFNSENALKAFYSRTYRDDEQGARAELPVLLASDVWRELLIQRDFESLFSSSDPSLSVLGDIQHKIQRRLAGAGADENSRERQVLAERGLRVLGVGLSGLTMPEEVRRKRIETLREDWKGRAGAMAEEKDPAIKKCRQEGQAAGREHALTSLTEYVRGELSQGRRPSLAAVTASLAEVSRRLAQDPTLQNGADLRKTLEELELWAQRLQGESLDRR